MEKKNIFVRLKDWIIGIFKGFWALNLEAKIGILFLIPPIIGVCVFFLDALDANIGFRSFPESWNCITSYSYGHHNVDAGYAATPAMPIYLGLMAIAGAYLIKGNLKKSSKQDQKTVSE